MVAITGRAAAVAAALALVTGASAAAAGWLSEGEGRGPTTASAAAPLVVEVDPAGVTGLYPGAATMVDFSVRNDNGYPVELVRAHPHSFAVDEAHADCFTSSPVVYGSDAVLHGNLAAGATAHRQQVRIAMHHDAGDACQGARFTFRIDVEAVSADI